MTFFRREHGAEGEIFVPLADAASRWTGAHLRGPAITALLARGAEHALDDARDMRPVRATFELHSPVPMRPCRIDARVLRRGGTLAIVEADLVDESGKRVMARARVSFVAAVDPDVTAGTDATEHRVDATKHAVDAAEQSVWATPLPAECVPPPATLREASPHGRLYRSSSTEWSGSRAGHQNADRNLVWVFDVPVVEGEQPSRFECAARAADLGNYVINMGADGLSHINTDVTLSLSRLPSLGGVGVCSELRTECAGVAVGTAHLFDVEGSCGTTTVTAVRHTKTRLDYGDAAGNPAT